ncbi:hypothetical protein [Shewanella algae]|jgi:hypothetical protein|uniref:hypothetical protein n=1 Tax=Shewanella algae TaxID=38313 RepID=UPI0011826CD7|nr:hypothetical protein [Shewanella algae]MBO2558986.1 hypothetical protein [Shewanella algae]MBO2575860.1 hypothetical protein [Shewanella algae]TVO81365.1 hypothetical protein AYI80_21290 [Shewanella algae]TXS81983.1 hypothetical protein AYI81_21250 [Shewanella algae]
MIDYSSIVFQKDRRKILTSDMKMVLVPGLETMDRMAYLFALSHITSHSIIQALLYRYVDGLPAPRAYARAFVDQRNFAAADKALRQTAWLSNQAELSSRPKEAPSKNEGGDRF